MMDGVRNGKIDTIIVKDLSRFGRDYIGVGEYMEQIFPLLGVRLIAINDNYDSNNYKGTTLGMDVVVSNLVNTMYCRDAGKKLRTANQVKWRKGITTASAAPFGYQFDPDKKGAFIIDPPAAKIVRRIHHVAIIVSDYEKSKDFYVNKLGFEIVRENFREERNDWKLDLRVGEGADAIELEIFAEPNPPKRVNRPEACGLRHLAFRVDDVEATVAELEQMGIECELIRLDSYTQKKMTFFFDPDGLPLELHE